MTANEIALLKQFVEHGDGEAFSEIVRRHAGMVYGISLRMLKDESQAADVVQETFLRLLHDGDRITDSLAGWLHRIATRKSMNTVRRDGRQRKREAAYAVDKLRETHDWQRISGYVDEAMEELDEDTRELLIQHFLEGRRQTDIAADENVSQVTVSRRIDAGVSELGKKLHNRSILVAAGALGSLLVQNAAQAAPAAVLKELGKIAIIGTAATSAAVSATAKVAAGVATGVKAKIITATAIAAVGIGGVATYQHVSAPNPNPKPQPTQKASAPIVRSETRTTTAPIRQIPSQTYTPPTPVETAPPLIASSETTNNAEKPKQTPPPVESTSEPEDQPRGYGGGYGGALYRGRAATSPEQKETETTEEPNDNQNRERRTRIRRRR